MATHFKPDVEIMQRYRTGSLTEEEEAEFEIWLLQSPNEVESLELDQMLSDGIGEVAEEYLTPRIQAPPARTGWLSLLMRPGFVAASAFALVAAAGIPTLMWVSALGTNKNLKLENQRLVAALSDLSAPAGKVFITTFQRVRGDEVSEPVRVPNGSILVFEIPVAAWQSEVQRFSVVLKTDNAEHTYENPQINDGYIQLGLNNGQSNLSTVSLKLMGDQDELAEYHVEVEH